MVTVSTIRYLNTRQSTLRYAIASSLLEIYALYNKFFFDKTKRIDKISLKLQLIDEYCRKHFKPSFTNHTINSALKLLIDTRKIRKSFLNYSLAPTNEKITINTINNIECAWVNLSKARKNGIIISFHGGAYVSGCARSCFPYLIPLCSMTGMAGCSVEYSLCPENLLPKPIEEGLIIYKYFIKKLKMDPKQIIFIGDSAGGSLVILLIQKLIKLGLKPPAAAITLSTWDIPSNGNSYKCNKDKDSYLDQETGLIWANLSVGNIDIDIDTKICKWINDEYKSRLDVEKYSYLSKQASFKGFCPLFMSVSEWEVVLDDSLRIKQRCIDDGIKPNDIVVEVTPSNGIHVLEDWVGFGVSESLILLQKEAQFILKYRKQQAGQK